MPLVLLLPLLSLAVSVSCSSPGSRRDMQSLIGFDKIKAARENVLSRLRALFQFLSSICFCKLLLIYSMAFLLIHAHGEEQTGICQLLDPAIIWDMSLVVNPEIIGLSPSLSTEQFPMPGMNICIPHVHIIVENLSPDPLGPLRAFRANGKVVVTVLASIGAIGLAVRMLYKRCCRAFTEADINMGLMREPAVPRRSNPTFEIHTSIE